MGVTHVDVTVRNPADPTRSWKGSFLVDTGAIDSLVPRSRLEAIGIRPEGQRVYELADGSEVSMDVAGARIEFMGELTAGLIIFSDADAEPLLGVTALESVGMEVDPQSQRLKKLPAVRLKRARRRSDSQSARRRLAAHGSRGRNAADGSAPSSSSTTARRNRAASAPITAR